MKLHFSPLTGSLGRAVQVLGMLWCLNAVALDLKVSPPSADVFSRISVRAGETFGDTGQRLLSAESTREGRVIHVRVYIEDLHAPGRVFAHILTWQGATLEIGCLPEGTYQIHAELHMQPWYGGPAVLKRSADDEFRVAAPAALNNIRIEAKPVGTNVIIGVTPATASEWPTDLSLMTNYVFQLEASTDITGNLWISPVGVQALLGSEFLSGRMSFVVPMTNPIRYFRVSASPGN